MQISLSQNGVSTRIRQQAPARATEQSFQPIPTVASPAIYFGKEVDKDKKAAADIIADFDPPKPRKLVQKVFLKINSAILLPWIKKVSVSIPNAELNKLRQLPKDSGNILVGTHPDYDDGMITLSMLNSIGRNPTGYMIASEVMQRTPKPLKGIWSALGAIPVRRGKPNPKAVEYLSTEVAKGGWAFIFPEGTVYHSRKVMPMEYGAVKISVEAALQAQEIAKKTGKPPRPMLITPYAHVYFHKDRKQMLKKMDASLKEVEARPEVFGKGQSGSIVSRIQLATEKILTSKAKLYKISTEGWEKLDSYGRAERVKNQLLKELEDKYVGGPQEGYERRRAQKIRMEIYEKLQAPDLTEAQKQELKDDVQKSMDVVSLVSFEKDYQEKYNDLEVWGEYLKRMRDALWMSTSAYGSRKAVVKVLPSVDIHPIATAYANLKDEEAKKALLFEVTEKFRQTIQGGVDAICKEQPKQDPNC